MTEVNPWTFQEWCPYCVGCGWVGPWGPSYAKVREQANSHDRAKHYNLGNEQKLAGGITLWLQPLAGVQSRSNTLPMPPAWVPVTGMPVTVAGEGRRWTQCTTYGYKPTTKGKQWEFRQVVGRGRRVFLVLDCDLARSVRPGWVGLCE